MRTHNSTCVKRRSFVTTLLWFIPFVLLLAPPWVTASEQPQFTPEQNTLVVFVREGCPHCADAKDFLPGFASERPWLKIVYRPVGSDEAARDDLLRISKDSGNWPPAVPTFVFNGHVLVGFDNQERTEPQLAALVDQHSTKSAGVKTELFGTLSVARLGLPLFTLATGLLDGFNPCAMWVLLFLLSMLVHLNSRTRMALIAGTFVLVSGAAYYAFMATWLNIFLMVGMSSMLNLTLGIFALVIGAINVKDFALPRQGVSLSISDSAKPGLYARIRSIVKADSLLFSLMAAATLAVLVNFIELLCTAGFPAMYTAILTQQHLSPSAHYAYLSLYILGYIADDTLMVTMAVIALSSRKLTEHAGRWLKLMSGVVMLMLGGIMIFRPEWLL